MYQKLFEYIHSICSICIYCGIVLKLLTKLNLRLSKYWKHCGVITRILSALLSNYIVYLVYHIVEFKIKCSTADYTHNLLDNSSRLCYTVQYNVEFCVDYTIDYIIV